MTRTANSLGGDLGMNTSLSGNQGFFSPQLSTDFLELPQSLREKREIYRHFYNTDEMVAQAIDLHTELPLSKVRLAAPRPRTFPKRFKSPEDYGKYILKFFERMAKKIKLFQRLITLVHHYWLDGTVVIFAEDSAVSVPNDVGYEHKVNKVSVLTDDGEAVEEDEGAWIEKPNREEEELAYYQRHYKGWDRLIIFPIDQLQISTFNFTDKVRIELIPGDRDRALIERAAQGDPVALEMVNEIPDEVREYIAGNQMIPLGTDPDEGSFAYLLKARSGAGEELGTSILDRCHIAGTPVLVKRDGVVRQVHIEDLDPDTDLVLSHTGAWREFEVGVRPVAEEIALLHVAKIEPPVGCTKDHKYPVLRDGSVVELHAEDIRAGDYLQVAQVPLSGSLVGGVDLAEFMHGVDYRARRSGGTSDLRLEVVDRTTHSFTVRYEKEQTAKNKTFPMRVLPLVAGFGYFLGFWLGDGHITKQEGLDYGTLGFTYDPNEPASVKAIQEQIKPMLDALKVAWGESPNGAGVHLYGNQDALVRWMAANFGHTSEDKHLPAWAFDANKGFLLGLLRGFCDSDGDVVRKKDGSISVRFNGTNTVLMEQIFLLCTSLGIPVSKTKPSHSVHFTHGPSVKTFFASGFLAKRQDPDEWEDGRSGSRHVEHEGKLFYRVQSVSTAMHEGPVYSLNVHEDHSFFAGFSRTSNCLRTLYYREKLRQAQTQIASRAMTPKRIVWAEDISEVDVDNLREQVDMALVDPDYSIVVNYEVHWEEMGSKDRLLDLTSEYEQTERRLRTGLGVTESLLSGETLYSGDRLKLEVINQRYLFLREILQEYVEEYLFKPVARRKGFVEEDEWGEEVVLYPSLSFTRLPLRDSQDTYDALFNLYSKGSISIDLILEMFNIDPYDTRQKLERDLFTVNDATFNEVIRGIYGAVGNAIAENTNVADKIRDYLGLKAKEAPAEEGRF
jgi:hypothetical protein